MREDVLDIYKKIKPEIKIRLEEFSKIWKTGTHKEIFIELAFCVLTPQSKAKNAWKAINTMIENDLLFSGTADEIKEELNIVRFKNRKAEYLVMLRNMMKVDGKFKTKDILDECGDTFAKRDWLVKNVKGIGFKEAGHFLRNVGFGKEVTILDRHILKNLCLLKVIEEIPKSITGKKYLEIEEKMKIFAKEIKIPLDALDLVLWYKEAGEVFK